MTPDPHPTPGDVEARLDGLSELHRLGVSLLSTRGAPLSPQHVARRALTVQGRLSPAARARVEAGLPHDPLGPRDVVVFASYAGSVHHVGSEFDALTPDLVAGGPFSATRCVLIGVTQQWAKPSDFIPAGWKVVCRLQFPNGIPAEVLALPELEAWGHPSRLWLTTQRDLERMTP
jgi:hypothetical protein